MVYEGDARDEQGNEEVGNESVRYGIIEQIILSMGGLSEIVISGETLYLESGFGMRQIASCFGSLEAAIDKPIIYTVDEILPSLLGSFCWDREDE